MSTSAQPAMHTPPVVSQQEWEVARKALLIKEKTNTRARDALALAASPTFAIMALLTGIMGNGSLEMSGMAHSSPMSGMVTMYLLMSVFHGAAWLKLMRTRAGRPESGFRCDTERNRFQSRRSVRTHDRTRHHAAPSSVD